jgi:transposase
MAGKFGATRWTRNASPPVSRVRTRETLHKASGVISPRVKAVGGDKFAIVCVDPAKQRSEWMMADYFGNLLIEPQTLEHKAAHFKLAITRVRETVAQHGIQDTIVVVERTGNYYLAPKRAFAQAGFETRVVHPFATKQFRQPADPGNKTDENDLYAQHRAAVAGLGLRDIELESPYRELQLRVRHRRDLVEKTSALACQIREHLHLSMPGYANLFDHLLEHQSALEIARRCSSPNKVLELGRAGLEQHLREKKVRHQPRTIDKVLAWAVQAASDPIQDGPLHHAIWTDLDELYRHFERRIVGVERQLAQDLVQTPYVRLMAIPGINVATAAELAGEMGPITRYRNANAITGRSGLYPSRHQSDQTDQSGPLIRQANRRLRGALMRIADSLACHCAYYRGLADTDRARGLNVRVSRVKTAKKFSRLAFACLSADKPLTHPCFRKPDSVLVKLRVFHQVHETPTDQVLADLQATVGQLAPHARTHEAEVVAKVLRQETARRRGPTEIGALLPAVLARLEIKTAPDNEDRGIGPRPV